MKRLLLGLFCVLLSSAVLATADEDVAKRAEASMLVTGSIVVAPDGSVQSYAVDHPEKLPSGVVAVIDRTVPTWKFDPVVIGGKVVVAKATMSLRIVARQIGKGNFAVSVGSTSFGNDVPGENPSYRTQAPIKYPSAAVRDHAAGTVYLLIKINRQGRVEDAAAEQVNLSVIGSDGAMQRWREVLAKAALTGARKWTFNLPTTGKRVADPYWIARIPVIFNLDGEYGHPRSEGYGQWQGYVPGPQQMIPWLDNSRLAAGSVDAMPDGGLLLLDSDGLRLKKPLGGT